MRIEDAVKRRRSIRRYGKGLPDEGLIIKIIEAGTWAPSGLNNQPWKFKIVKGKQKDGLAEFTKYGKILEEAPAAICVFLDNGSTYSREKDIMAIGASIENMLLVAYESGLGTCWLGEILNRRKEVEAFLGTDKDHELMAVVTLGYPSPGAAKGCRKNVKSFILK